MENTTNTVETTQMGSVLLVSYNDSKFLELVRKHKKAFVLDARQKGWSSNKSLKSDALADELGKRYKLMPQLALISGESPEEYVEKIKPVIERINMAVISNYSVIITCWNTSLLKIMGQFILGMNPKAKVFLKWENEEDKGISLQKLEEPDKTAASLLKICERLVKFEATGKDANAEEDIF